MSVKSFDFDDIVSFEITNQLEVAFQLLFFLVSPELSEVDGESFDFSLKFKLKSELKFDKDLLVFKFDTLDGNCGFSGDFHSDFFDVVNSFVFNFNSLNNKPFSPVFLKVF